MATAPPTITAPPAAPSRTSPSTFAALADAWVAWLESEAADIGTAATRTYDNAVEAYASAVAAANSATTAASVAGATLWVSGTSYSIGDMRKSPANGLVYRRITSGAGTTDPSADATNWALGVAIAPQLVVVSGTSQTAQASAHYVLTNAAATTVTLPASPSVGDTVWVTVANGRSDNVIARNGNNIMGLGENLTLNDPYITARLRYVNASKGWWLV